MNPLMSPQPPANGPLAALWHDLHGDWENAHRLVQDDSSPEAAWVHAYLHRREGDAANARYWYARAGRPAASGGLDEERAAIAAELLEGNASSFPKNRGQ